jgi:hypothetical protein
MVAPGRQSERRGLPPWRDLDRAFKHVVIILLANTGSHGWVGRKRLRLNCSTRRSYILAFEMTNRGSDARDERLAELLEEFRARQERQFEALAKVRGSSHGGE